MMKNGYSRKVQDEYCHICSGSERLDRGRKDYRPRNKGRKENRREDEEEMSGNCSGDWKVRVGIDLEDRNCR